MNDYISTFKAKTKKQLMLEQKIKNILASKLLTINQSCITLMDVDISPDGKRCILIVSSIMIEKTYCLKLMEKNLYILQKHLAKNINARFTPKLSVKWDASYENFLKLQEALKNT